MDNQDLNPGDEYDWNEGFVNREIVRRRLWAMGIIVLCAVGALFVAAWLMLRPAAAHDWFTGRVDPVTHVQCCGGNDCSLIPANWFENGAVMEGPNGYEIKLTPEQTAMINFTAHYAVQGFVEWPRVQMSADDGTQNKGNVKRSGFAMCIWGGEVKCFFKPPGNAQLFDERRNVG